MLNQVCILGYLLFLQRLIILPRCLDEDAAHKIPDVSIVESSAEMLYGLVHQRYILTRMGLQAMVCRSSLRTIPEIERMLLGGQIREWDIWLLSTRVLCRMQRRSMRPIRYARSRYCEAILSQLQRYLRPTQQSFPRRRWYVPDLSTKLHWTHYSFPN